MDAGKTTSLAAAVSNDTSNAGVKWSVSCGNSQCGSFSPASTASGATTAYTAPASAPSPATVTVTATSVADATKSASAVITISAPSAPIAVTFNPAPPASLAASASVSLIAVVSNDNANAGVKWTVACGSAQCGSFNPASTPSGTATNYTAPAAIPTPATVTVTATSVTDTTKSASASITIIAPPPVLADGNYVYHLGGEDGTGPYFVAGVFTVQNGVISGGEQDAIDDNLGGGYHDNILPSGSSMSLANGNIQVVLNTGDANVGVNGVETMRGAMVSNARVLISEFDTSATANGSLDLQTGTAAPSGGYAFSLGGLDGQVPQSTLVVGGILNISGASLSTSGSVFDYNDGGKVGQAQSFSSGTVGSPDGLGRVEFTLNPSASSGLASLALAGYIVGPGQIQMVETNDALNADLGGEALGQSNTAQFTEGGVVGSSYVYGVQGEDSYGVVQIAGGFGLNANGAVSGDLALNDLSYQFGSQITSGTYTVDPTGRVTLNVIATVTPANAPAYTVPFAFQLYLDGNGNGLVLGVDQNQQTAGPAYLQNAPADFEGSYALGALGFGNFSAAPAWSAVGAVTVSGDSFSGFTDYSVQNGQNSMSTVTSGVGLSGSENSSTGLLTLYGLSAGQNPQAQSGFGYYPIDNRRVLAIEIDSQQSGLMMLEGIQPE
jgi:hypothetical protein